MQVIIFYYFFMLRKETADILAILDQYALPSLQDDAKKIADDFRLRRVEKGITREEMAKKSGVALGNIARFEQKGLVSLKNLISLASALGYLSDLKNIFAEPKFSTMAELQTIRKNTGKKKAYPSSKKNHK
ncbi:MAG: helix-turn-helix domain-containing protein [Clostridium sp.]|nr:helix-turn-helix domain-containing protein [Clostridium sp.]